MVSADELHRTMKLDLDEGRAQTVEEAAALAGTYRLRVHVGDGVSESATRQAALLTAVNAGARAFLGGVEVTGNLDWVVSGGWEAGTAAGDAVMRLGGRVVDSAGSDSPVIVVGEGGVEGTASVIIHPTWEGWAAGVAPNVEGRLVERMEHPASGVFAGALGVAEAFSHVRGSVAAGRRRLGVSLWDLGADWTSEDAVGPQLRYLPDRLWIGGLGHLGQGYLWNIGFLPYKDSSVVQLFLQDFDHVVEANRSTGLLVHFDVPCGILKTRMAADALEALGFATRLIERRLDETTRPGVGEPTWVLAGFDRAEPRRHLGAFDFAVDLGLGSEADDYNGVHLHTFPAAGNPLDVFTRPALVDAAAPVRWAQKATDDACGVVQLQGAAVGAAFVGAAATAIGLGQVLRALAGEPPVAVAAIGLNSLGDADVVSGDAGPPPNPGFQLAS